MIRRLNLASARQAGTPEDLETFNPEDPLDVDQGDYLGDEEDYQEDAADRAEVTASDDQGELLIEDTEDALTADVCDETEDLSFAALMRAAGEDDASDEDDTDTSGGDADMCYGCIMDEGCEKHAAASSRTADAGTQLAGKIVALVTSASGKAVLAGKLKNKYKAKTVDPIITPATQVIVTDAAAMKDATKAAALKKSGLPVVTLDQLSL